jgi:hypothetical protein
VNSYYSKGLSSNAKAISAVIQAIEHKKSNGYPVYIPGLRLEYCNNNIDILDYNK